jgi:hypothetical protein
MSDKPFAPHEASAVAFDPANPNAGPNLNWQAPPEIYVRARVIAGRIAGFINDVKPGSLNVEIAHADLICLHCNGRPQDFVKWEMAPLSEQVQTYATIYSWFDRRTGKVPDFVKLPFDAT